MASFGAFFGGLPNELLHQVIFMTLNLLLSLPAFGLWALEMPCQDVETALAAARALAGANNNPSAFDSVFALVALSPRWAVAVACLLERQRVAIFVRALSPPVGGRLLASDELFIFCAARLCTQIQANFSFETAGGIQDMQNFHNLMFYLVRQLTVFPDGAPVPERTYICWLENPSPNQTHMVVRVSWGPVPWGAERELTMRLELPRGMQHAAWFDGWVEAFERDCDYTVRRA
jgi:hypothetical protein